ncbi:response regulator [Pseudoxanthomonas sp. LjRoot143]|uniref:response regulator n=1 Tax=Pseudoxanthomonas sp. LjRoot143 TaxID=3342266 RepID=UPI003ECFA816
MTDLTILYIDDDDRHRTMVAEALELAGHRVTQAASGSAAQAFLQQQRYDCVVTDYDMPGITGAAVVSEARRLQPGVTVCVVSGHAREDMSDLPTGTLLMTKPFSVPLLLDVLSPR